MTSVATSRTRSKPRASLRRRLWIRHRSKALVLVRWLGPTLLKLWSRTWRVSFHGTEHLESVQRTSTGHFMALWHGRMILGLPSHARYRWHVLVSRSGDGDVSGALLRGFGYRVIRGSSSRGGASAIQAMLRALRSGSAVIVTPDGPRGPRHSTNEGLPWMAGETGAPILPCGFACDRAWRASSWDGFTIPKLGARVAVVYGAPLTVAHEAPEAREEPEAPAGNEERLARAARAVQRSILEAERQAFASLGLDPDW